MEAQEIESKLETLHMGQKMLAASVDRIENGLFGDMAFNNEGLINKLKRHQRIIEEHEKELKKIKDRHFKTTAVRNDLHRVFSFPFTNSFVFL